MTISHFCLPYFSIFACLALHLISYYLLPYFLSYLFSIYTILYYKNKKIRHLYFVFLSIPFILKSSYNSFSLTPRLVTNLNQMLLPGGGKFSPLGNPLLAFLASCLLRKLRSHSFTGGKIYQIISLLP